MCRDISSQEQVFLSEVVQALDKLMLVRVRAPGGAQQPSGGAGSGCTAACGVWQQILCKGEQRAWRSGEVDPTPAS